MSIPRIPNKCPQEKARNDIITAVVNAIRDDVLAARTAPLLEEILLFSRFIQ